MAQGSGGCRHRGGGVRACRTIASSPSPNVRNCWLQGWTSPDRAAAAATTELRKTSRFAELLPDAPICRGAYRRLPDGRLGHRPRRHRPRSGAVDDRARTGWRFNPVERRLAALTGCPILADRPIWKRCGWTMPIRSERCGRRPCTSTIAGRWCRCRATSSTAAPWRCRLPRTMRGKEFCSWKPTMPARRCAPSAFSPTCGVVRWR